MTVTADAARVEEIVSGTCRAPFDVLGIHRSPSGSGLAVRVFLPWARSVDLARGRDRRAMTRVHEDGFFEAAFPDETEFFPYRLDAVDGSGRTVPLEDPYRFPPVLTEEQLKGYRDGTETRAHRFMGARVIAHEGIRGTCFAVWAPNARAVAVMASFNGWESRRHPMRPRGSYGVWELFVPGIGPGELYKYDIRTAHDGLSSVKADPFGFAMEMRPNTASVIHDIGRYAWDDAEWMRERERRQARGAPLCIYEAHLGSWKRRPAEGDRGEEGWLTYRDLARELVPYARRMGFTHIELLPVSEYPYDGSWGYQTVGHFAPTSRYGSPDDFRFFVDKAHQAGLGIILDWVPAHFPRDAHGLGFFDGTHLYEHADPRQGAHPDWGTLIYNYGRPQVSSFLISNALFWLEEYHVDGLRVDAVASMLYLDYSRGEGEWIPNRFGGRENLEAIEFIKRLNVEVHGAHPGVLTFAEESTAWTAVTKPVYGGGLGFDLKWNMGWMNDTLEYVQSDPLFRKQLHEKLTFSIYYAFSESFLLPLSHDEVVHMKKSLLDKMPGDPPAKFANLRLLYGYMYSHPGKKLLFMGGELGQWREWNHEGQLQWELLADGRHKGLQRFVRDLNGIYRSEPSLHEIDDHWDGFEWIDFRDASKSVISYARWTKARDDFLVVVANFTPVPREGYRVGVPVPGKYRILLNGDASKYGGSGRYRKRIVRARMIPQAEKPQSVAVDLPPLSVLYLKLCGTPHPA